MTVPLMVPLLPIPHDWVADVARTRTWPTAVLPARDGSEERLGLSVGPREAVTYQLTVTDPEEGAAVDAALRAAAAGPDAVTRRLVRVPRWEDALVLGAPAAAGDATLALLAAGAFADQATLDAAVVAAQAAASAADAAAQPAYEAADAAAAPWYALGDAIYAAASQAATDAYTAAIAAGQTEDQANAAGAAASAAYLAQHGADADADYAQAQAAYDATLAAPAWAPLVAAATAADDAEQAARAAQAAGPVDPAADDAATLRAFADGGEVALWTPGRPVAAVALAPAGAVAAHALTLAAPLAAGDAPAPWPPGTRVAPVHRARLPEALAPEWLTDRVGVYALALTLDPPVAGTVAEPDALPGQPAPGRAEVAGVAALRIVDDAAGSASLVTLYGGFQRRLRVTAADAAGAEVPVPGVLQWAVDDPTLLTVVVPAPEMPIANIEALHRAGLGLDAPIATVTATDPVSGLVATYRVVHGGG
ncbi:hypothetical protein tb265_39090 [Gemmatimonadetes bacterium T265]|nr:hypothetical protein tb265_39090 [Gemmatimonadetes bacterium T265]